ncbi:MAG: hypothetical protein KIS86_06885 [Devosia sp.]|nr:hypothetical protein [Devosia sp.]
MMAILSIHLDDATAARLQTIAANEGRTQDELASAAVSEEALRYFTARDDDPAKSNEDNAATKRAANALGHSVPAEVAPGIRLFIACATHEAVGVLTPVDLVYEAYCAFCARENHPRALAVTFATLMEALFTIDRFRYQRRFVNLALNEGSI